MKFVLKKLAVPNIPLFWARQKAFFTAQRNLRQKQTVNPFTFQQKSVPFSKYSLLLFPTQQVFCIEKYLRLMISLVWVNVSSEQVILNYPRYNRQGCFILRMISDVVQYKMCDNKSCWETTRYLQCCFFPNKVFSKWLMLLKWAWSLVHPWIFPSHLHAVAQVRLSCARSCAAVLDV